MSEDIYIIKKIGDGPIKPITESELKRRIQMLANNFVMEDLGPVPFESIGEAEINVLLHGEVKGEVHDHIPLRGLSIEEIKREYPKEYAEAITEAEEFTDAQPYPAPTREEWEAWAKEMAIIAYGAGNEYCKRRYLDALLSMPIVPRK